MDSKKPLYKSIPFWIMVLFLLYSSLGFFAVPYFVKKEISQIVSNNYNSNIDIEKLSFNPYRLTTNIKKVTLTDKDQQLWFSADTVHVNFSLIKTIFNNTHISEITLDNPHYHLLLTQKNGLTNLRYPQITPANNDNSEPVKLDIENININQGSVSYLDQTSDKILKLSFKKVGFKNIDFSTDDKYSQFDLNLITEFDDNIKVTGQFNLPKLSATGKWQLSHFSTETLFKIISDKDLKFYGFTNQAGYIDGQGSFDFNAKAQEFPDITIESLNLIDFKTKELSNNQPKLFIPKLSINDVDLDLNNKQLNIKSIALDNSKIDTAFDANNQLIWSELSNNKTAQSDNRKDDSWQYNIEAINGSQILLTLNKDGKNHSNSLLITNTEVANLTNAINQDTTIDLTMIPDKTGTIAFNSKLQLHSLVLDAKIKTEKIDLKSLQTWIPKDVGLIIEEGFLSLQQNVHYSNNDFQSVGWIKLNTINISDQNKETLLKVNELELTDNKIDSKTKTIALNRIKLDKAEGSLSVSSENKLNISNITTDKTNQETSSDENDWIININQVDLIDSQTNFIDRSIQPNYQSNITNINGSIKALSSLNTSKADVDLQGVLDTYGQLDIKGKINPLSEKAYTDLAINIQNIDLQNFSTYSTKFLGFPINRGKADFELNYKLNQSVLKGLNDLEFKQLQLGNKIQSDAAINLPLKLAVSLLTDNNGIMSINLPVSGRIDDPEFSYGGLVFKAFFKLITGIVASPFKILGKLIPNGTDLDMSSIQFIAGTDTLITGEEKKLKAMKSILQKRTSLILELSSNINTIEDNKSLKNKLLLDKINLEAIPNFTLVESIKPIKKTYIALFDKQKWKSLESNATTEELLNHSLLAEKAWKEMLEFFSEEAQAQLATLGKNRTRKIQQLLIEDYEVKEARIFLKPAEQSDQIPPQVKFGIAN